MGVEIHNGACADQREYVGFEAAHHRLGVARCPLGRHFRVPVQRNASKGSAFDYSFRFGLVLGFYGINAIRQHSLDFQALAARIGDANDGELPNEVSPSRPSGLTLRSRQTLRPLGWTRR